MADDRGTATLPGQRGTASAEAAAPVRMHTRVRHGLRKPHNWIQLSKFFGVGGSGYVVNLAVFYLTNHVLGIHHLVAATLAFVVAVINNFWWNRHWTFGARQEHPAMQGVRFFTVSLVAFGFSYVVLISLVDGAGFAKVFAQAISIAAATPLSFIGQKLWSFRA
jgi:putative flippase GtrA